jgi:hypothetical protein
MNSTSRGFSRAVFGTRTGPPHPPQTSPTPGHCPRGAEHGDGGGNEEGRHCLHHGRGSGAVQRRIQGAHWEFIDATNCSLFNFESMIFASSRLNFEFVDAHEVLHFSQREKGCLMASSVFFGGVDHFLSNSVDMFSSRNTNRSIH